MMKLAGRDIGISESTAKAGSGVCPAVLHFPSEQTESKRKSVVRYGRHRYQPSKCWL